MGNKITAWESAEKTCYNYLRGVLGGQDNTDAYCGELPDTFTYNAENGMWLFALGGEAGDKPLDYDWNMDTPGGGKDTNVWVMPAKVEGAWVERSKAIRFAGLIRANLPIAERSLAGIYRFRIRREPAVVRGVVELAPDQAEGGGKIRVWVLDYPMEVWFTEAPA